ncbi:MAG: Asp23/Gls24 family envelope stress response protein [Thermoleophilia bacterium]|nr:Asp23/Gls24 family envelope stress response protein [Gaiellaceae bacterium]MDW8337576.1 Asp23/Gls24 family envelope stress response protein [Thermoleophilia bacterium]
MSTSLAHVPGERITLSATELGEVAVSLEAVEQIVRSATLESYGVLGLANGRPWWRALWRRRSRGISVSERDGALVVELRVIAAHGLRLAEVAAAVRERVEYELSRMVAPVGRLDVRIEQVRTR